MRLAANLIIPIIILVMLLGSWAADMAGNEPDPTLAPSSASPGLSVAPEPPSFLSPHVDREDVQGWVMVMAITAFALLGVYLSVYNQLEKHKAACNNCHVCRQYINQGRTRR